MSMTVADLLASLEQELALLEARRAELIAAADAVRQTLALLQPETAPALPGLASKYATLPVMTRMLAQVLAGARIEDVAREFQCHRNTVYWRCRQAALRTGRWAEWTARPHRNQHHRPPREEAPPTPTADASQPAEHPPIPADAGAAGASAPDPAPGRARPPAPVTVLPPAGQAPRYRPPGRPDARWCPECGRPLVAGACPERELCGWRRPEPPGPNGTAQHPHNTAAR